MKNWPAWLRLLRPTQWAKNLFVFAPVLFGTRLGEVGAWGLSAFAFVTFCIAASLVYVINDYVDVEADRAHPIKSLSRPIASGQISLKQARMLALALFGLLALALLLQPALELPVVSYWAINLIYSYSLRGVPVLDLVIISLGFVARVWAGAAIISVPLTPWILIDTFFLALYLAAMKRRSEFLRALSSTRKSLGRYNLGLINSLVGVGAVGAVVGYSIFAFDVRGELSFTTIFVVLGIARFWRLANSISDSQSPTDRLIRDPWMLAVTCGWALSCLLILASGI